VQPGNRNFRGVEPRPQRGNADGVAQRGAAARPALVYQAAQRMDDSLPCSRVAAIAKVHASHTAKPGADAAVQIKDLAAALNRVASKLPVIRTSDDPIEAVNACKAMLPPNFKSH
jgi:hypothetical protein